VIVPKPPGCLWEHCRVTVDPAALVSSMPFSLGLGIELEAASAGHPDAGRAGASRLGIEAPK
jgi:hypothetical protein